MAVLHLLSISHICGGIAMTSAWTFFRLAWRNRRSGAGAAQGVSGGGNVDENRRFENPVPLTHSGKIDPWICPKG